MRPTIARFPRARTIRLAPASAAAATALGLTVTLGLTFAACDSGTPQQSPLLPSCNAPDAGAGGDASPMSDAPVGSPAVGCTDPPPGVLDYITDMEDGSAQILYRDGRVGQWFTYHDATTGTLNPAAGTTPTMEPIPGGRCGSSTKAMRVTGSGFSDWGAGFGFDFKYGTADGGASMDLPYDASANTGVTFWARIGDTSISDVRVSFGDQWSQPAGGHCDVTMSLGATACYDNFGVMKTLTTTWQRFTIPFGTLAQRNFGLPRPSLDTTALLTMQFDIAASASVFDIWIDDVAFYK